MVFGPSRAVSFGATAIIPIMIVTVSGRRAAPDLKAPKPYTCASVRLRNTNIGIQAAPSSSCATLAAARFGTRKMPRRISG